MRLVLQASVVALVNVQSEEVGDAEKAAGRVEKLNGPLSARRS
jgi:hypothetical protein